MTSGDEEFILTESTYNTPLHTNTLAPSNGRESVYSTPQGVEGVKRRSFSRPLITHVPNSSSQHGNSETSQANPSLFFNDGIRSIDFVLVWDKLQPRSLDVTSLKKRQVFEENLEKEGLELERDAPVNGLCLIKVHASNEVLRRYSDILKLRLPMKKELCTIHKDQKLNPLLHATMYLSQKIPKLQKVHDKTESLYDKCKKVMKAGFNCNVDDAVFPKKSHRFTAVYSMNKEYLFDVDGTEFFTSAVRSRIVHFILDRQKFSEEEKDDFAFGIERLINEAAYSAAYPLHDGDLTTPGTLRYLLYHEWADVKKCLKYQPLDYVKEYFGVKMALYFAWLGFYTHMLIPASIVGLACFIYSYVTIDDNPPSRDICENNLNIKMCPLCDYFCDYWDISETCLHAKVSYLIDNPTTVFFAIFMSFWAAMFLELWKRYSSEITHRWDLTGFDIQEEHPRPQYLARLAHVKGQRVNIVTNSVEPHVPFWRMRFPATMLSFSIVLLLVAMALAAVLGVVLYRMSLLAALSVYGDSVITSYAILFTTATAASINLCCIILFNWMYTWLAEYLTELELLRTQTEFDDSLTLKIYLLQFVNYYASIFYIAFFKGKIIGYPGQYNRFFGYRQEECGPGGCLMELCIQLSIIMVGKQAINTVLEMWFPVIYRWIHLWYLRTKLRGGKASLKGSAQWLKDMKLIDWGPRGLFPEYLEMVLQYGFVTIFVAAFPLAPVFALLNNVFEMRLDARKLLTFYRRPVTQRVRDIGVWFKILNSIGKLAVITNGFIIAFTSEFIPRLVYRFNVNHNHTLVGYLNHSLSYFNVSHFEADSAPHDSRYNISFCRYPDYREPPWDNQPYSTTNMYWHVLAARLAFVVVFENVVALVMLMVRWCVPDMPGPLRDQIRREAYITNEIIIAQEAERARRRRTPTPAPQSADSKRDQSAPSLVTSFSQDNIAFTTLDIHADKRGHPV